MAAGGKTMKKTKIICTMGPNADDRELLKALSAVVAVVCG